MKWALLGPAIAFAVILGLRAVIGVESSPPQPVDLAAQIKAGCEREFAGDIDAVTRCRGELVAREFAKIHRERMERAAR